MPLSEETLFHLKRTAQRQGGRQMTDHNAIPESAVDPICGKTIDPRQLQFSSSDDKGVHYFCSEACQRKYDAADKKAKKGIWARYTERLKKTHCTRTPPECR